MSTYERESDKELERKFNERVEEYRKDIYKKTNNPSSIDYYNAIDKFSSKIQSVIKQEFVNSHVLELEAKYNIYRNEGAAVADTFNTFHKFKYAMTYGELYYLAHSDKLFDNRVKVEDLNLPTQFIEKAPDEFVYPRSEYSLSSSIKFSTLFVRESRELDEKLEEANVYINMYNNGVREKYNKLRTVLGLNPDTYFVPTMLTFAELEGILSGINIFYKSIYINDIIIRDELLESYSKNIINFNNKIKTMYKDFRDNIGLVTKVHRQIVDGKIKYVS